MTAKKKPSTNLSKTLFMKGLQCHKALYLEKYQPELKGEMGADLKLRVAGGLEAGNYAKDLFPGGIDVPYEGMTYDDQVAMTRNELVKGTKTIYEATFSHDGIFVKVDILHKGSKGWEMYEVKAANDYKEHYLNDISLQYHVATEAGVPIKKASIVYMNRDYVRRGAIEPKKLFVIDEITAQVRDNQAFIRARLDQVRKMLRGDSPKIDIGLQCTDPYECDFMNHCWEHLPCPSVFDLCGSSKIKWALYYEGHHDMAKLPLDRLEPKQRFQLEAFIGKEQRINSTGIRQFLDSLSYPLCFLDFETFEHPLPPFEGTRPYQKIPFQYSLHLIEQKESKPKHYEYLVDPGQDPREEIARGLIEQIPANASILVYHKSFEIGIMKNLKEWFPKYAGKLDEIIDNIRDLKDPFSQRLAYHWKMQGSASLKVVLPAFIPEMTYEDLEITEGGAAQAAYFDMCEASVPKELKRIRKALLKYCKQDTLAMVKLWRMLQKLAN